MESINGDHGICPICKALLIGHRRCSIPAHTEQMERIDFHLGLVRDCIEPADTDRVTPMKPMATNIELGGDSLDHTNCVQFECVECGGHMEWYGGKDETPTCRCGRWRVVIMVTSIGG